MNEADIRNYARLMQELGLTGLEITEDNKVMRLERSIPAPVKEVVRIDGYGETPSASGAVSAPAAAPEQKDCVSVKSPLVGVFYAAPAENADPYVSIGDRVKKGQTLCIVEAMKLMNEIVAEEDGVISDICVTNSQVVEFGTELFRMKR
ncbi:MAG: acetyl-CoA carboxylase biotin carboxyl carrier protein [Lachnospiraceae bacterium]|nr:acetyl-CoA carboxylase biotin carboxyl carrier protein [Lachnospiraceae bacterium]